MRCGPLVLPLALACIALPGVASAQYKNTSFGLDIGYWAISKPSIVDPKTSQAYEGDQRPLRLQNGIRLGGESNFKMDEDHFWFTGRVNVGFLQFPVGDSSPSASLDRQFDAEAHRTLGTILGIEGQIGVRYVIFTDRFRPYLQASLSYMHLMSFTDAASGDCDLTDVCSGENNSAAYLAHPNVGGVHLQPGLELIFKRDLGIHIFVDIQRWLLFNANDNNSVVAGIGVLFFM
jgi:hypothetical protein